MMLQTLVEKETPGSFMEYTTDVKIKALLRAGAMVNAVDNLVSLCSKSPRRCQRKDELAHLLMAAGETLFRKDFNTIFPAYRLPLWGDRLRDLCRHTIRNHLLQLNQVNLFYRVPKLGLPASMTEYVLLKRNVTE